MALSACPSCAAPWEQLHWVSFKHVQGDPAPSPHTGTLRFDHSGLHVTYYQHQTADFKKFLKRGRKPHWVLISLRYLHLCILCHSFSFSLFFSLYVKMLTFVKSGLLENQMIFRESYIWECFLIFSTVTGSLERLCSC